jgi:hypothetical protein
MFIDLQALIRNCPKNTGHFCEEALSMQEHQVLASWGLPLAVAGRKDHVDFPAKITSNLVGQAPRLQSMMVLDALIRDKAVLTQTHGGGRRHFARFSKIKSQEAVSPVWRLSSRHRREVDQVGTGA